MTREEKANPNWGECYLDHFEKYLGQPVGRAVFEQNSTTPRIQIFSFDGILGGCRAFCSFGLSRYASLVGEIAEVFMPVDDGWDQTPILLADTLFYIVQHNMRMGWGISIGFGSTNPEFSSRFNKTAIYITTPFGVPESFSGVRCGPEIGLVYLAFYVTAAEHRCFEDHGAVEFERILHERNPDVFHIARLSSV